MTNNEKQFEQIVAGLNVDDRPNAEHKQALRKQMLAACKAPSDTTAPGIQPIWSKIMKSNITKSAAAAIIIIVVLTGIYKITGSIDGASVAYADVERNMQETQSMSYTINLKRPDKPEITYHLYVKGSSYRKTDSGGSIQISSQGKLVNLNPSEKHATISEHKSPDRPIDELLGHLDSWHMGKVEELGERMFDGRTAVGFRTDKKDGVERKQLIDVWVDVQTKYPVLIEANYPEHGVNLTMGNFVWNAELDDSLFDLTIPEGYSINDRG